MGGVDTAPEMERMTDMRVYADQAATTSLSKTALEAMLPWMTENFGNPSALYEEGRTARDAVETAREKIAHLLHAKAKEIYFTSGGTEADNWALQMAAAAGARTGKKEKMFHHVASVLILLLITSQPITLFTTAINGIWHTISIR